MHTGRFASARRAVAGAVAALVAVTALAGCHLIGDEPGQLFGDGPVDVFDVVPDKPPVTIPDALAAPGAVVALGETIRVPGSALTEDSSTVDAEVGMTIMSATELDASFYSSFENAEEFVGIVPWAVMVQTDLDEGRRETLHAPETASVFGILEDGSFAQQLGLEMGSTGTLEDACPGVTADDTSCDVVLVPEGATLTQLAWDGLETSMWSGPGGSGVVGDEDSPYASAPITWKLP